MNENADKEMKELTGEIADEVEHTGGNENVQRPDVSLDLKGKGKILILGGVGILLLIVLIAIFSGGGNRLPTKALNLITVRLDLLEERLTRLEGVVERIELLEDREKELHQSIVETDKSGRYLTQRLDRLSQRLDRLQQRAASVDLEAEAPGPVEREPIPLAKGRYHEVRSGENLYRISRKYGISVQELCRLNNMTPGQVIHPGQKLLVAPGSHQ